MSISKQLNSVKISYFRVPPPQFLYYNAVVLKKKKVKCLKIALLGPCLGKNRASMGHTQNQVQVFFLEITIEDHKLSRSFLTGLQMIQGSN